MAKRVVVVMAALAVLSALVASMPEPKGPVAPKNKCTHVLAPGESC